MSEEHWPRRTADRFGRFVLLTEERWRHIIRKHDEFGETPSLVLQTVRFPNLVTRDARHANRQCLYAFLPGDTRRIKVVVEYSGEGDVAVGVIITAYFTERVPTNEAPRWP